MNAVRERRERLGWYRQAPAKAVQKPVEPLPAPVVLTVVQPPPPSSYVWPGHLCAEFWLSDVPNPDVPSSFGVIKHIISVVALIWGVPEYEITGKARTWNYTVPRHVAFALACRLSGHSLPQIGRYFGGRDHTTILHAKRKMAPDIAAIDPTMNDMSSPTEWARALKERLERPESIEARKLLRIQNRNMGPRPLATQCGKGHPYTEENTRIAYDGRRRCRTCDVLWNQARTREFAARFKR